VPESLSFDGWGVATLSLERRYATLGEAFPDKIFLFRAPDCWPLVVLRHSEREGAEGRSGHASVTLLRLASVDALAAHVERTYGRAAWYDVLEAGRDDPELFAAWVPEWFPRAFDKASIKLKDLALFTGLWSGEPVPAPGRELEGWERDALAQMAARLVELGFQVTEVIPASAGELPTDQPAPGDNPLIGELRVRRYGFEVTGVVRVDSVGEIYVRLPDDAVFTTVEEEVESP
jgi:hypothetical protein